MRLTFERVWELDGEWRRQYINVLSWPFLTYFSYSFKHQGQKRKSGKDKDFVMSSAHNCRSLRASSTKNIVVTIPQQIVTLFFNMRMKTRKRVTEKQFSICRQSKEYEVAASSRLLKIVGLFAKELYKRDDILYKRPIIWSSLLIVVIPYARTASTKHIVMHMGWLRLVGSFKLQVSFAEYRLFYRAPSISSRTLLV